MRKAMKLHIDSVDLTRIRHMEEAFQLIGGRSLPEADQKGFGAIFGNDFTFEQAQRALAIVKRHAAALLHKADTEEVFTDAKLQAVWADGVRSTARLAIRQAEQFMSDLRADLLAEAEAA